MSGCLFGQVARNLDLHLQHGGTTASHQTLAIDYRANMDFDLEELVNVEQTWVVRGSCGTDRTNVLHPSLYVAFTRMATRMGTPTDGYMA